jgi:predicted acyl esterase
VAPTRDSAGDFGAGRGAVLPRDAPSARSARRDEAPDGYRYDPDDPVSRLGGPRVSLELSGPQDHQWLEKRDDVLCYTTAPFEEPLAIAGTIQVELWATTDGPDTDWIAKLLGCRARPGSDRNHQRWERRRTRLAPSSTRARSDETSAW